MNFPPAFEWLEEHAKFPVPTHKGAKGRRTSALRGDRKAKGRDCPGIAFQDSDKIDRLIDALKAHLANLDTRLTVGPGGNQHMTVVQVEALYKDLFDPNVTSRNGVMYDEWCTVHSEANCGKIFSMGPMFAVKSVAQRLFGLPIRSTFEPTIPKKSGKEAATAKKLDAVTKHGGRPLYCIEFNAPEVLGMVKDSFDRELVFDIDFNDPGNTFLDIFNKCVDCMRAWKADFLILTSYYETYILESHTQGGEKYVSYSLVEKMKENSRVFLAMLALVLIKTSNMERPEFDITAALSELETKIAIRAGKEHDAGAGGDYKDIEDDVRTLPEPLDKGKGKAEAVRAKAKLKAKRVIDDIDDDEDDGDENDEDEEEENDDADDDDEDDEDEDKGCKEGYGGGCSTSGSDKKRGPPDNDDSSSRSKRRFGSSGSSASCGKGKGEPRPGRSRHKSLSDDAVSRFASPIVYPRKESKVWSPKQTSEIIYIKDLPELIVNGISSARFLLEREHAVQFPSFPTFDEVPCLVVKRRLGDGRTGHVYQAELLRSVDLSKRMYAIKFVDADARYESEYQYCLDELHDEYVNYCYLQIGKRDPSYNPVINAFTPVCYGLFTFDAKGEGQKFVLITEFSGGTLRDDDVSVLSKPTQYVMLFARLHRETSIIYRRLVMESLLGVHSLGMIHGDADGRNMVLQPLKKQDKDRPLGPRTPRTIKLIDFCESKWHDCNGIMECAELRYMWLKIFPISKADEFQEKMVRKHKLSIVNLEDWIKSQGLADRKQLGRCFALCRQQLKSPTASGT